MRFTLLEYRAIAQCRRGINKPGSAGSTTLSEECLGLWLLTRMRTCSPPGMDASSGGDLAKDQSLTGNSLQREIRTYCEVFSARDNVSGPPISACEVLLSSRFKAANHSSCRSLLYPHAGCDCASLAPSARRPSGSARTGRWIWWIL